MTGEERELLTMLGSFQTKARLGAEKHRLWLSEERRKEILCGEGRARWVATRRAQILGHMGAALSALVIDEVSFPLEKADSE